MVAFSYGLTAAEDWCNGSAERKYDSSRKCKAHTRENTDAVWRACFFEGLHERTEHLDIFLCFHPSLNGVLFTGGKRVSDFSVL